VDIARQHQHQLVLLADPVAQLHAQLGTVLPGVGQVLSVQAQAPPRVWYSRSAP
jgi:hypothetical protein